LKIKRIFFILFLCSCFPFYSKFPFSLSFSVNSNCASDNQIYFVFFSKVTVESAVKARAAAGKFFGFFGLGCK